MPVTRDAYHHGDLHNALVASAARLIERGGPSAFSLREAAREVGVSANAAYRHFDDKSALMTAVASDGLGRLARRMRQAMDRAAATRSDVAPSVARFKAVGRAYVEFALENPELFRAMFGECAARALQDEAGSRAAETPWGLLATTLDALVADGWLAPERRAGAELKAWSVVHGFAALALDGNPTASVTRQRAAQLESVLGFTVLGLCGRLESPVRAR
ncbi:MAG: TetR/AcrR family transcriptional regulator [bacterium]